MRTIYILWQREAQYMPPHILFAYESREDAMRAADSISRADVRWEPGIGIGSGSYDGYVRHSVESDAVLYFTITSVELVTEA